jgi:hypothetical protein
MIKPVIATTERGLVVGQLGGRAIRRSGNSVVWGG